MVVNYGSKKFGVLFKMFLFLQISFFISSCTSNVEKLTPDEEIRMPQERTVLKIWMRGDPVNALGSTFIEDVSVYEKAHPNVKIYYEFIDYRDVENKWNTALAGGNSPDIFEIGIINLAGRANLGQYEPLDAYINDWPDKDDIYQSFYKLGSYKNKIYGLAYMPAPDVFAYRKDYFQEAGFNPEHAPGNWDELKQYAAKLVKTKGDQVVRAGFDIPRENGEFWFEIFSRQNGNAIVDEANEIPIFDQPSAVEAIHYLIGLLPYSLPYNDAKPQSHPFVNGLSAMTYISPYRIQDMLKKDPALKQKIGIVSNVPGKYPATFNGMRFLTISSKSKYKEEAWDFIQFMMSKERMRNRMIKTKIPSTRKSLKDEYIRLDPDFNGAIIEAMEIGEGRPNVTWSPLYEKYARQGYEEAIFQIKPAEKALAEAVQKLQQEIGK